MKLGRLPVVAIGVLIGMAAGSASADVVNERMRQMFGAHTNVTKPGVVEGATRGVVTGGNVTVRNPIQSNVGWSFDPPSVAAGCGGIDLYGGNLSFPDKEQYVQMGRAIIGNIGGAAFRMALRQTCELCDSIMSSIQDTVNMLNFDNMSSCQIAQQMVEGTMDNGNPFGFAADAGRRTAASWGQTSGKFQDYFSSYNSGKGKESPVNSALADPEMAAILQGNLVWNAMLETGALDWLGSTRAAREELMSLIGTVVTCAPGSSDCPARNESGDIGVFTYRPTLTLAEFAALERDASAEYRIYGCRDDECLNPVQNVQRRFSQTLAQLIVDTYLGAPGQPGLLQRSVMGGDGGLQAMTPLERTIVANTNSLGARVFACAAGGDEGMGHAQYIVEQMAPQIAAEVMHVGVTQAMNEMRRYLSSNALTIGTGPAEALLEESRIKLDGQLREIRERTQSQDMLAITIDRCSRTVNGGSGTSALLGG